MLQLRAFDFQIKAIAVAGTSMTHKVMVDANTRAADKDERYLHGEFETLDAAIEACKVIIDDFLARRYQPGMSADSLYDLYKSASPHPWIVRAAGVPFSSWIYAKQRCAEICAAARRPASQP
jgi:hypothetical protein